MDEAGIIGFIEAVTPGGVIGWALRPGAAEPLRLRLVVDGGALEVPFVCDGARADVWAARADLAASCGHGPRLGFRVPVPAVCFDGREHRFDILTAEGAPAGLLAIGRPRDWAGVFAFPRLEVVGRARLGGPEGRPVVQGWVFVLDRMTGERRVGNRVALRAGDGWSGSVMADRARPDVALDQGCDPACGFDWPVAAEVLEGGGALRLSVLPEELAFGGEIVIERAVAAAEAPEVEAPEVGDDDGRLWIGGVARSAVFGISGHLAALRAGLAEEAAGGRDYASDPEQTVGTQFDRGFYLDTYRDVRDLGVDPVLHYVRTGWLEGRWPAPWFDTDAYLAANPDVREAGVNPFWHFLVVGRREGRVARREGGWRRERIDAISRDAAAARGSVLRLRPGYVAERLACLGGGGLVVAVAAEEGLFVTAEQGRFAGLGWHYLLMLPAAGGVRLVLDGEMLGVAEAGEVGAALSGMEAGARVMVVHGLVGHDVGWLAALRQAAGLVRGFVWLHDFSLLCAGGTLLRNDVAFCGAPAGGSDACLVCVHGAGRVARLDDVARLVGGGGVTVVAPSVAAAAVWRGMSPFGALPLVERAPYRLDERAVRIEREAMAGTRDVPVRVAFAGGDWGGFRVVLERAGRLGCYRFYHLPGDGTLAEDSRRSDALPGAGPLEARLAAAAIDLLVVLPLGIALDPGVVLAGMAAGADVVTLASAEVAAEAVKAGGGGVVAADIDALCDFFASLRAVAYVRRRAARGRWGGVVAVAATTAEMMA